MHSSLMRKLMDKSGAGIFGVVHCSCRERKSNGAAQTVRFRQVPNVYARLVQ